MNVKKVKTKRKSFPHKFHILILSENFESFHLPWKLNTSVGQPVTCENLCQFWKHGFMVKILRTVRALLFFHVLSARTESTLARKQTQYLLQLSERVPSFYHTNPSVRLQVQCFHCSSRSLNFQAPPANKQTKNIPPLNFIKFENNIQTLTFDYNLLVMNSYLLTLGLQISF